MDYSEIEKIICEIQGVTRCKLVRLGEEITEIHVLASCTRSPKQISRDIETALLTILDYKVDRKVISIAQINTEYEEKIGRVKFEGISMTSFENSINCEVSLDYEEDSYKVLEIGIKSANVKKNIVAKSTLKAVEKILGQDNLFDLLSVNVSKHGDISYVNVLVTMVLNSHEEIMVGSSIIKDDINESIAKATLAAINRRILKTN